MRRFALTASALLATVLAALPADAQLGLPTGQTTPGGTGGTVGTKIAPIGTGIEVVRVGPSTDEINQKLEVEPANVFISNALCSGGFEFEFTTISPRASSFELWVSRDGTDCSAPTSRSITNTGQKTSCWFVGRAVNAIGKSFKFRAEGRLIFNANRLEDAAALERRNCDSEESVGQDYYLWFLSLATRTESTAANIPPVISVPYRARFTLYSEAPAPPSAVKVKSGENTIRADWGDDADPNITFRAYFDTAAGADCTSSALSGRRGSEIEVDNKTVFSSGELNKPGAALGDLDKKGLVNGQTVAIAVAREDPAGNIGTLSEIQCAKRVETIGAIDACGTPADCGLETCGLSPASRGSWFGLSLFGLLLAALIRRRTA